MKHLKFFKQRAFRFRRFTRKAYAAFASMHRVVNIGRLASYVADCQLRKSVALVTMGLPIFAEMTMAQSDDLSEPHLLPTLDVVAVADSPQCSPDAVAFIPQSQIQGLPIASVGELLQQLPGLDLRTRGGNDIQGDLSMRGGTFDQMIVMLNGVILNDAQTGHHNLDIPIDLTMVNRVEIIPASALIHYGLTSLCGAVNIVTTETPQNQAQLDLSGGSFGQVHLLGGVSRHVGNWTLSANASHHRSDGYQPNTDYQYSNLFLQLHQRNHHGTWNIQAGGQLKDFGSQAFYSTRYPDQFEATRTLLASITHHRRWQQWELDVTLYGRLHKDRFELFRQGVATPPSWYSDHNYHLSSHSGLRLRVSRRWQLGNTAVGVAMCNDAILSNVLGDSLAYAPPIHGEPGSMSYPLGMSRQNANLFAEHSIILNKLRLSASVLGSHNSRMGNDYGYSLVADYHLSNHLRLDASLGRSLRLPTYTDLYYHSANQISNPDLLPEVGYNAEVNLRYGKGHLSTLVTLFGRHSLNIIDWVRQADQEVWYSINHAQVNALGTSLQASYQSAGVVRRVGFNYTYCRLSQQEDGFISSYVLDYLKHKLSIDVVLNPMDHLQIKCLASYHLREGQYNDAAGQLCSYPPVFLLNGGAAYQLSRVTLYADVYNILNREYCDYGGVPQPGFSFMAGIKLKL